MSESPFFIRKFRSYHEKIKKIIKNDCVRPQPLSSCFLHGQGGEKVNT